ncbi:hypothetical protein QE422_000251 [Chryseobacterium sp. SORGH_AS 447]|uniref:hypothetical protein n=1 Tax=Chryseobacterium sp. SORGH_AS_0447 TaxID=3041769 RepID=UPI00277FBDFE|nr:hypothetical protein [Chryseobacterium sp. SORGH_AS_0447]MDQ1159883.1 hypothetical protein [Chryseobacterium sp. SORGH_AS_0447]
MKIEIKTPIEKTTLEFDNEEYFKKIHAEIIEAITDDLNIKGVYYEKEGSGTMFPALLLKNSLITVHTASDSSSSSPFLL